MPSDQRSTMTKYLSMYLLLLALVGSIFISHADALDTRFRPPVGGFDFRSTVFIYDEFFMNGAVTGVGSQPQQGGYLSALSWLIGELNGTASECQITQYPSAANLKPGYVGAVKYTTNVAANPGVSDTCTLTITTTDIFRGAGSTIAGVNPTLDMYFKLFVSNTTGGKYLVGWVDSTQQIPAALYEVAFEFVVGTDTHWMFVQKDNLAAVNLRTDTGCTPNSDQNTGDILHIGVYAGASYTYQWDCNGLSGISADTSHPFPSHHDWGAFEFLMLTDGTNNTTMIVDYFYAVFGGLTNR